MIKDYAEKIEFHSNETGKGFMNRSLNKVIKDTAIHITIYYSHQRMILIDSLHFLICVYRGIARVGVYENSPN